MWTIDYALQLASLGYNSAYIHTREAGVTYNLFDPPAPNVDPNQPGWTTGPPYHALLVVAEALYSANTLGMAVVDLNLTTPRYAPPNSIVGYGLYPTPNATHPPMPPTRLVLFNFGNNGTLPFEFNINDTAVDPVHGTPMVLNGDVAVKYLLANDVNSNLNITWGGQVVSGGGVLQGDIINTTVLNCGLHGCLIGVPGPGVAVVFLDGPKAAQGAPSVTPNNSVSPDNSSGSGSNNPGYLNPSGTTRRQSFSMLSCLLVAAGPVLGSVYLVFS